MTTINDLTNVDPNNPNHYQEQREGESYLQYMLRMGINPALASAYLSSAYAVPQKSDTYYNTTAPVTGEVGQQPMQFDEMLNRQVNPWLYMTQAERDAQIQRDQEGILGWANHWADRTDNPAIGAEYANTNINNYNRNYMNPYAVTQNQPVDLYNNDWQKAPSAPAYTAQNFSQYATPQAASTNPPAITNNTVPAATGNNAGINPNTGTLNTFQTPTGSGSQGANTGAVPTGSYQTPAAHVPGLNRTSWRRGTWNPVQGRIN